MCTKFNFKQAQTGIVEALPCSLSLSLSLSPLPPSLPGPHSTDPLTYKDKLVSHLQEEEGDWNLLEVAGMAEETELITERMGNLNLLEKRAIVAKKKENARKEIMKVEFTYM